jgi:diguanylate cyclase (GGDEF)-like protein
MSSSEVLRKAETAYSGDFESVAKTGGKPRLYTFTRVGVFPLVLTIGVSSGPIYAGWRRQAWYIGAVVLILAAATIGLAMFAARELRKRTMVESELALLATTDSLTGLYNRRIFDESLSREWQRAIRDRTSLSLLMIDADNFKEYNDRYGHQAGDDVLAAIAICVGGSVRSVPDLAARYGGEEFAILLPGSSLGEALAIAESVHANLAGLTDSIRSGSPVPTVSIGVASCEPSLSNDANELVTVADRALYTAKKNGRNRTECGGSAPSVSMPGVSAPSLGTLVKAAAA